MTGKALRWSNGDPRDDDDTCDHDLPWPNPQTYDYCPFCGAVLE
jgi:hypothetical protein